MKRNGSATALFVSKMNANYIDFRLICRMNLHIPRCRE